MKKTLPLLFACLLTLVAASVHAQDEESDAILGRWFTESDESIVEIYRCDETYCGKIVWLKEPTNTEGEEKKDLNNPDESKRDRKIVGMDIVWGFKYAGRNTWSSGKIYDPNNGNSYSCNARLKKDKLSIRGFIGVALFGRTTVWRREE